MSYCVHDTTVFHTVHTRTLCTGDHYICFCAQYDPIFYTVYKIPLNLFNITAFLNFAFQKTICQSNYVILHSVYILDLII